MLILERSLSTNQSDVLMSKETFYTASELIDDSILTFNDLFEVKAVRKTGNAKFFSFTKAV